MISNNVMLDALQSDHTTLEGLKMLVLTWNVNAKLEESTNLRKLFFREEEQCFGGTPEIVVLGLQEMVELSTSNVIGGSMVGNAAERVEQWRAMLLTTLKEKDVNFEMVTSKNMVGLWITVFALRSFKQHIGKVQVSQLGRGVGGVLGNKGAVYARFNVKDTSVCLICAHFAAHRENLLKRNEDFHAILSHKAFPGLLDNPSSTEYKNLSQHNSIHMSTEASRCERMLEKISAMKQTLASKRIAVSPPLDVKKEQLANYTSAKDHDVIIWLGDLNYRLLGGMENSRIYDIIDGKRSYALLNMDQLNIEKDKNTVFQGFHEGLISFDPTYKYSPGTPNYNRERCPAWCDRILWKLRKADIDVDKFRDVDSYVSNEHKLLHKKSAEKGSLVSATATTTAAVPVAAAVVSENTTDSTTTALNNNSSKTIDTSNTSNTPYTVDSISTITEIGDYPRSATLTTTPDTTNSTPASITNTTNDTTNDTTTVQDALTASAKSVGIADCGNSYGSSLDDAELVSPLSVPSVSGITSPNENTTTNNHVSTNAMDAASAVEVPMLAVTATAAVNNTDSTYSSTKDGNEVSSKLYKGDNSAASSPRSYAEGENDNEGEADVPAGAEAEADECTYVGSDNEGSASSAESDTESVNLNNCTDTDKPTISKSPRSEKKPRKPKYRSFRSLPPMPEIRSSVHLVPEARVTEIVELMVYNRGENIISDHKPVRALLGVKFKRVNWSAHEKHLLTHYQKKCHERPFHTKSFQTLHATAPVTHFPRTVTLFSGFQPERAQNLKIFNNSPTHSVKFGILHEVFPSWMSVDVLEGVIPPLGKVTIEVMTHSEEANKSYYTALEEDARYADAQLRDVWRRQIRNPDERGNPQLSAVLQVILCTHLSPDAAFTNKISVDSFGTVMRPGDLTESTLTSVAIAGATSGTTAGATVNHAVSFAAASVDGIAATTTNSSTAAIAATTAATATTTTDTDSSIDAEAEMFTVRMAPLLIPVLCKVSK